MQGAMLKAVHSGWLSGNLHAPALTKVQPNAASRSADIDPAGNGMSAAAGSGDLPAVQAAMREVLDEQLWPLEALLDEAVSKRFYPMCIRLCFVCVKACISIVMPATPCPCLSALLHGYPGNRAASEPGSSESC